MNSKHVLSSPTKAEWKTKREMIKNVRVANLDYIAINIYSHIFTTDKMAAQLPLLKVQQGRKPIRPEVTIY
ncbi:MAG: hypothetical protein IM534_05835 [Chitinophagaceae bacterium]|nr:hypothetical protein [Chitinophagaceae bacterium]MCA6498585.1 hypothetical protein [Chitinophagaceae bacterium]